MFDKLRDPISGLTHFAAAIAAVLGLVLLLILGSDSAAKEASLAIYGTSLVLMFSASAAYHLIRARPAVDRILRKLDHSAIYLLIAGTYTPICLHYFSGFWKWGLLGVVWAIAAVGIGVKIFFLKSKRWLNASIYLVMGWLSILAVKEIVTTMPVGAVVWLVLGGLFFTVGAVVYIAKRPNFFPRVFGFHEIWHIFVILGCACHYVMIAAFVAAAAPPM